MINYKSFKLPGNAKLRVRADHIIATVSSKDNGTTDLYVAGIALPWHIKMEDGKEVVDTIDYVWERHSKEEDEE